MGVLVWDMDFIITTFFSVSEPAVSAAIAQTIILHNEFENYTLKIVAAIPGANELKQFCAIRIPRCSHISVVKFIV